MKKIILLNIFIIFAVACVINNRVKDPLSVLDKARRHVVNEEYSEALKDYIWFFENSTKIEKTLLAVRLSTCLIEWRELGNIYTPALIKYREELAKRKEKLLDGESDVILLMEYNAMCKWDGKEQEAIDMFIHYHEGDNKEFAKIAFSQIKYELAKFGYYGICTEYVKDPFQSFEQLKSLHGYDEDFYDEEVIFLLTVLKKNKRDNEFEQVKNMILSYGPTEELKNKIIELQENGKR